MSCILSDEKLFKVFNSTSIVRKNNIPFQSYMFIFKYFILANFYLLFYIIVFFSVTAHLFIAPTSGFGVSRIEPLCYPACRKRRLMEASRGFPAGAIPSVVNVEDPRTI